MHAIHKHRNEFVTVLHKFVYNTHKFLSSDEISVLLPNVHQMILFCVFVYVSSRLGRNCLIGTGDYIFITCICVMKFYDMHRAHSAALAHPLRLELYTGWKGNTYSLS